MDSPMHVAPLQIESDRPVNGVLRLLSVLLREPLREQLQTCLHLQLAMTQHVLADFLWTILATDLSTHALDRCICNLQSLLSNGVSSNIARAREACRKVSVRINPVVDGAPCNCVLSAELAERLPLCDPFHDCGGHCGVEATRSTG